MVSDDLLAATRPRTPVRTPLTDLAAWLADLDPTTSVRGPLEGVEVTGVSLSSQRVVPGDLYAALPGSRAHGIEFAADAVAAGAVGILTDPAGAGAEVAVPLLVVDRPRAVLGRLAAHVYGEPAGAMRMIGVTGTQGKTTTTRLAESGLQWAGVPAAVIGTVGTRMLGVDVKTTLTTPEAPDLHSLFAVMRERGVEACVMEVSSHALVMGRVDGVVFDVAVFLNLGRDHLDFHRDLEDYYRAKASLFTPQRARLALVNVDDEHGRRLAGETDLPVRTFAASGRDADWRAVDVELGPDRSHFVVEAPDGRRLRTSCPIPGDFNVLNTLAAIAACGEADLADRGAHVASGIAHGGGVPGRMERVDGDADGAAVVVDYAHKPDAVGSVIRSLRDVTESEVIVVLGAGGDRDPGKRPLMGRIAAELADVVVVTDDNPRSEDPGAIRAAVLEGARQGRAEVLEIGDRRLAIRAALERARSGDAVLILGKGHETGQDVAGVVHPFDDREVARQELERLGRR